MLSRHASHADLFFLYRFLPWSFFVRKSTSKSTLSILIIKYLRCAVRGTFGFQGHEQSTTRKRETKYLSLYFLVLLTSHFNGDVSSGPKIRWRLSYAYVSRVKTDGDSIEHP